MKMKLKKTLAGASLLTLSTLALTSCGNSRNTQVPYGDLNLDAKVAEALNGELSVTTKNYYNKLRLNGNSLVENKIKEALYNKEYKALTALFYDETLTEEQKNLLIPTKNGQKLFELTGTELSDNGDDNFTYIKKNLIRTINNEVASAIYSTNSAESIEDLTQEDKDKKVLQFINSRARVGEVFTSSDLVYTLPTDDTDNVTFDNIKSDVFKSYLKEKFLTQAAYLSAQNALYQIADEEYVKAYDAEEDDEPTKNTNLIYDKEENYLKNKYDVTHKTYGVYHAIIIQFDSLKEATAATEGYDFDSTDIDYIKNLYLTIYNNRYNHKTTSDFDDEKFTYEINPEKNDFDDLSDNIKKLVTEALEEKEGTIENQFLSKPRNIDNKYVLAVRYDSTYAIDGGTTETEWKNLDDDTKAKLTTKYKYDILKDRAASYSSTNFKEKVYTRSNNDDSSDDIFIYDPIFEYKFSTNYANEYNVIEDSEFSNENILSIKIDGQDDPFTYSVKDFYNDASLKYGSTTLYNMFAVEYAYKYYDEYVDSDTHDENVEALDDAISTFKSNENSTYPKEIGLENFLLLSYGYDNYDDVVKYYYDANSCLSSYLKENVFKEWAKDNGDGTYTFADNIDNSGILYNILTTGNKEYENLFKINLDHVLINIDDDGDGTPDDPEKLFENVDKDLYESQVKTLTQALYLEALYIHENYSTDSSLYEVFTHVKNQYELGNKIFNPELGNANWDQWKNSNISFNFLITVEQLSSSGDINQVSVNNFVEKFKKYVVNTYKSCVNDNINKKFEDGVVYVYDSNLNKVVLCESEDDVVNISADTMCATEFGYHLLILNSYSKPDTTDYTASDDPSGIQSSIKVLIDKDEDDEDNNIYVTCNSYNSEKDSVSFNQLFIYYCQKNLSQTSSLDSSISALISSMFDSAIEAYTNSNFQNYLLINYLNINVLDNSLLSNTIQAENDYYKYSVIDYNLSTDADKKSDFYDWVNGDLSTWKRPNQK